MLIFDNLLHLKVIMFISFYGGEEDNKLLMRPLFTICTKWCAIFIFLFCFTYGSYHSMTHFCFGAWLSPLNHECLGGKAFVFTTHTTITTTI